MAGDIPAQMGNINGWCAEKVECMHPDLILNRQTFHPHNLQGVGGRAGARVDFVIENQHAILNAVPEMIIVYF